MRIALALLMGWWAGMASGVAAEAGIDPAWTHEFNVERAELSATGENPYFSLRPGHQLILAHKDDVLTITVLNETRRVDGVETRVVEEREAEGGELVEVSRNYYAISSRTNAVFYFGEEVDIYEDGKIAKHEGEWLAGEKGAKFGLMMPGLPLVGAKHYQEVAPGVALDQAEILEVNAKFDTPARNIENCVKVKETSPLEPGHDEVKHYAYGIGLIQDGDLVLREVRPGK